MADAAHVAMLNKGVEAWQAWRDANEEVVPDLTDADLSGKDLCYYDLHYAKLQRADLTNANLDQANVYSADFSEAKLAGLNISHANLQWARFVRANLRKATIIGSRAEKSSFEYANLIEANLANTDFSRSLFGAADFSKSYLSSTSFLGCDLRGARFSEAVLGQTNLVDADMRGALGLESCEHSTYSYLDHRTISNTGKISRTFLQGVGLPDPLIQLAPEMSSNSSAYATCFISYSSADAAFAKRLHQDLETNGVRCYFAPEDMKIGEKILDSIDIAITGHDKLLLILSESSIASGWVEDEVTKAYAEERRRDETMLLPLRIDNAVMGTDEAWAVKLRDGRNIGDFTGSANAASYVASFERLMDALSSVHTGES